MSTREERARAAVAPIAEEYPFAPHFHEVGGHGVHYLDEGPRDAPPALFLHGNPTWSFLWRDLVRRLSGGMRCVAPDHLGCGLSDRPRDFPYTLEAHAGVVEQLVLDLDLRDLTLVVHDWGGAIGMGFAVRHPERVARLVITNTAAFRSTRIPLRIAACRLPVLGRLAVVGLNGFARAATVMAVERPLPPIVRRGFLLPYRRPRDRAAIHHFVRDIPMRPSHPSWDFLGEIEAGLATLSDRPACILWGERDWCFSPAFREEWQRRLPGAEVHRFEDAGHFVLEDAGAAALDAAESFLATPALR